MSWEYMCQEFGRTFNFTFEKLVLNATFARMEFIFQPTKPYLMQELKVCNYHTKNHKIDQQVYCWKIDNVLDEEDLCDLQIEEKKG